MGRLRLDGDIRLEVNRTRVALSPWGEVHFHRAHAARLPPVVAREARAARLAPVVAREARAARLPLVVARLGQLDCLRWLRGRLGQLDCLRWLRGRLGWRLGQLDCLRLLRGRFVLLPRCLGTLNGASFMELSKRLGNFGVRTRRDTLLSLGR